MSKCKNCGADLPENGKFCTTCGTKVEAEPVVAAPVQEYAMPEQNSEVNKEKKPVNKKLFIIIGAAVLALIIIIVVAVCISNVIKKKKAIEAKTIDFKEEYLNVVFDGYDTLGTVSVTLNREEFQKEAYTAMGYGKNSKSDRASEDYLELIYAIDIQYEAKDASNGDEIVVKIVPDKKAIKKVGKDGVIFKETEFTFTVEGLKSVVKYNPFDDIEVTLKGKNGDVTFTYSYNGDYDYIYNSSFEYSQKYYLSKGDTVTLTLEQYYIDKLLENGVLVTQKENKYTVDKCDEYISSIDKISSDLLSTMKDRSESEIEDEYDGYFYDLELDSTEYLGMYLFYNDKASHAYLVYKGTVSEDGTEDSHDPINVYMAVKHTDLLAKADGTQSSYSYPSFVYNSEYMEDVDASVYGYLFEDALYTRIFDSYNSNEYDYEISGELDDFSKYDDIVGDEDLEEDTEEESEEESEEETEE